MVRSKKLVADAAGERFDITVRMKSGEFCSRTKQEQNKDFNRMLDQIHDALTSQFHVANIVIR